MSDSGSPSHDPEFETLLEHLRRSRGFDFTGYKRASLMRRVTKRMQTVGVQGFENYIDYLEVHPEEFGLLFDTILINVTAFFRKDLRRSVIFGRHDLVQDAPISRIDILVCRNTLMYFNAETQGRILDRFHFALNDRGALFLGKAETLLTYNNTFAAIDLARR